MSEFLDSSKVLIENARNLPEIAGALAEYGYDGARFAQGASLWAAADALAKAKERGEKNEATSAFDRAWEKADGA